jgi:Na+-transporting NADH:ubiquinone oxidoreductase subunit C
MVIVVAAVLAVVAMGLKSKQTRNIEIKKKQDILSAINVASTTADAEELYAKYVTKEYLVNEKGEEVKGENDPFHTDLKKQRAKAEDKMVLPVFECQTKDGLKYVLPLRGAGLWGPIWCYISLNDDMNTIYGALFDHEGETPGLGAEIATDKFSEQFIGKKIFTDAGELCSIYVVKVGQDAPAEHKVDGISGGTLTSNGVRNMLKDDLTRYEKFLNTKKQ